MACGRDLAGGSAPGVPVSGAPQPAPKTSKLAIAALVFALIPACLYVVGLVLGIVALVRINGSKGELKGQGLAIAAIVLSVVWFFVGILAAIAIPSFLKYQGRAKAGEARVNLKSIYTADRAFELDHPNQHAASFEELGFTPSSHRRYAYFYGSASVQPDMGGPYELDAETRSQLHGDEVAFAVSNLDSDPTLDLWTIDAKGELHHVVDDLSR